MYRLLYTWRGLARVFSVRHLAGLHLIEQNGSLNRITTGISTYFGAHRVSEIIKLRSKTWEKVGEVALDAPVMICLRFKTVLK
jgi:hypothetical protein